MSLKIVIGGGTGFIGRHLVKSLRSAGHQVTVISRNKRVSDTNSLTWEEIQHSGLPSGTQAVCNLSGRNILEFSPAVRLLATAHQRYVDEVFSSRINTTQLLVKAACDCHSVTVVMAASAIGYYPPSQTVVYDESYTGQPDAGLAGRLCSQVERCVLPQQNSGDTKLRRIAARIGIVLGNGGGVLGNMRPAFMVGVGGRIGSGEQGVAWIHMRDCVRLLEFGLTDSRVNGVMNVVAPADNTNADLTQAYAKSINRPAVIPLPAFAADAAFGKDRSYILTQGVRVRPVLAEKLGFQFEFTELSEACRDLAS